MLYIADKINHGFSWLNSICLRARLTACRHLTNANTGKGHVVITKTCKGLLQIRQARQERSVKKLGAQLHLLNKVTFTKSH